MFMGMMPQGVTHPAAGMWDANMMGTQATTLDRNRAPGGTNHSARAIQQLAPQVTMGAPAVSTQPAPTNDLGGAPMNYAQPTSYQPMLQQAAAGQPINPVQFNMGMANRVAGANPFARYMQPQYNPYIRPDVLKAFMGQMGGGTGGTMPLMAAPLLGAVQGYGARLMPQVESAIGNLYQQRPNTQPVLQANALYDLLQMR